jgi:hypothetical protein
MIKKMVLFVGCSFVLMTAHGSSKVTEKTLATLQTITAGGKMLYPIQEALGIFNNDRNANARELFIKFYNLASIIYPHLSAATEKKDLVEALSNIIMAAVKLKRGRLVTTMWKKKEDGLMVGAEAAEVALKEVGYFISDKLGKFVFENELIRRTVRVGARTGIDTFTSFLKTYVGRKFPDTSKWEEPEKVKFVYKGDVLKSFLEHTYYELIGFLIKQCYS